MPPKGYKMPEEWMAKRKHMREVRREVRKAYKDGAYSLQVALYLERLYEDGWMDAIDWAREKIRIHDYSCLR